MRFGQRECVLEPCALGKIRRFVEVRRLRPAFPERNVLCHLSGSGRKRFCPPGHDAARIRLFRCPVHPGGRIVGRPGTAPVAHEAVCERALFANNLTKKP